MNAKKVIRKYVEYITTKIRLIWEQKSVIIDDVKIKYLYKKSVTTSDLIVIFSSCTRSGIKARYNYVRTLKKIDANKLFILDDYAEDHRGSYYMGSDYKFNEEKSIEKFIRLFATEHGAEKIIFCGSSKGGYSALNFGIMFRNAYIIAGAPQYFLASYLYASGNLDTLKHILGTVTSTKEEFLNLYLKHKIEGNEYSNTQTIYLHYSNKEHTYEEHIRHLIEDLSNYNYLLNEDIADYSDHSEISYYFPEFLVNTIKKIRNID